MWNRETKLCLSNCSYSCLKGNCFPWNVLLSTGSYQKNETKSGHGRSIVRPISDLTNVRFQYCHRPCTNDRIGASKKRLCLEELGTESSRISVASRFLAWTMASATCIIRANFLTYSHSRLCYYESRYNYPRDIVIHYASFLLASCLFHARRFLMKSLFATRRISGQFSAVYWCSLATRVYAPVLNGRLANVYIATTLRSRMCICPHTFWNVVLEFWSRRIISIF